MELETTELYSCRIHNPRSQLHPLEECTLVCALFVFCTVTRTLSNSTTTQFRAINGHPLSDTVTRMSPIKRWS